MTSFHIPRSTELVRVTLSKSAKDIKPFIERALDDDGVLAKIEPHITNGGTEGHKLLDLHVAAQVIIKHDNGHGGNIANKHLPSIEVVNQLKVVLRRRFVLDKKAKVVGLNPKFANLLAAPAAPATAE